MDELRPPAFHERTLTVLALEEVALLGLFRILQGRCAGAGRVPKVWLVCSLHAFWHDGTPFSFLCYYDLATMLPHRLLGAYETHCRGYRGNPTPSTCLANAGQQSKLLGRFRTWDRTGRWAYRVYVGYRT